MSAAACEISAESPSAEWTASRVLALFEEPFADLIFRAQEIHRRHFEPNRVQLSALLSIKTGGCPEDCAYCPQSSRYQTEVGREEMMTLADVRDAAARAKSAGATRFCMGAAWRGPKNRDIAAVCEMVREVKSLGLESCATLGLLRDGQAETLRDAGLDFYNHNIDSSPDFYGDIISTRKFEDRLDTLEKVRNAGLQVCCGGIVGMGESRRQRAGLISALARMNPPPKSVPINHLVRAPGTPLADAEQLDGIEFVRTIAAARITMPKSYVRLSAGRAEMPEETQALCFLAGANSIFYGEKLLTTGNPDCNRDRAMLAKLGISPEAN